MVCTQIAGLPVLCARKGIPRSSFSVAAPDECRACDKLPCVDCSRSSMRVRGGWAPARAQQAGAAAVVLHECPRSASCLGPSDSGSVLVATASHARGTASPQVPRRLLLRAQRGRNTSRPALALPPRA